MHNVGNMILNELKVDKDAEELTSQFFSYRYKCKSSRSECVAKKLYSRNIFRRNDGRHRPVAKTPTWQVRKHIV